ncbi:hypothetical protein OPQ81_002782 [Rhizoctonia solani]|nr:hypothetical protein OPQ81_002782 [Rhizoctonia solani]
MDSPSVSSELSSATDPSPSARALSTAKAGSHPTSPIAYWPQIWPRGLNDFISPPTPSSLCCQGSVADHKISSQLSDGHLSPSELRKAYLKHKSTSDGIGITQNEPRIISAEYYELPDVDMIRFRTTEDTDILHGDLILQHQPERPGSFVKAATSNKRGNFRSLLGLSTVSHGFHAVAVDKMDTHVISTFGIGYLPQRIGFISPLPFDSLVVLTQMISSRLSRSTIASQQPTLFAKIMWNCLQWLESQKRVSPPGFKNQ